MRPKTSARDLPPRMLRRERRLKSGKLWVGYYYDGRDEDGKRREIPLGTDLTAAKRRWAELDCVAPPAETGLMREVFDRYEREVTPKKSPRSQSDDNVRLKRLCAVFGNVHIDDITPQHIAIYRDRRGETAPVRANREMALFSHVFNMAREWGLTAHANPCRGIRRNRERPRKNYVDDEVWQAVYAVARGELRDAMDLAYLTGQRPADVLSMRWPDIRDGALEISQAKTGKRLRIIIEGELAAVLERIRARAVSGMTIIATKKGKRLTYCMRRERFNTARLAAIAEAERAGDHALAARISEFQFRDIRPKAASDTDLAHASALLGHTGTTITERVYRRRGEIVKPLK
ncbi:MAG: tyrosine-type recombinase/integrase [Azoarcus sp.]|nr:tyrosine-type recombinase/integrase [Azoarcus sp.]